MWSCQEGKRRIKRQGIIFVVSKYSLIYSVFLKGCTNMNFFFFIKAANSLQLVPVFMKALRI